MDPALPRTVALGNRVDPGGVEGPMLRSWLLVMAVVVAACRPAAVPGAPSPTAGARAARAARVLRAPAAPGAGGILVGFVCPAGAEGRPLFLAAALRRSHDWTAEPEELRDTLARGRVREIGALGYSGRLAGRFTPLGPVDLGRPGVMALGAYAGAAPCADEATASECVAATSDCGLAAGSVVLEEAPRPPARGACAAGGHLVVDVDGDGRTEGFALAELASALEEVGVSPDAGAGCTPRFAGSLGEGIDLLGVADLDLDGRFEVAVSAREGGGGRRIAIYGAGETPARLDLLGVVSIP